MKFSSQRTFLTSKSRVFVLFIEQEKPFIPYIRTTSIPLTKLALREMLQHL
jgi:hypothetical protein